MGGTLLINSLYYYKGRVIFREGDTGDCMYIIKVGKVGIYKDYDTPARRLIAELGPGEYFGEMGMVRGFPRSATAVSQSVNTEVRIVNWETLADFLKDEPAKVIQIMQQMSERLAATTEDYLGACEAVARLSDERRELLSRLWTLEKAAGETQGKPGEKAKQKKPRESDESWYRKYLEVHMRRGNF